jgi:hypothetical protein
LAMPSLISTIFTWTTTCSMGTSQLPWAMLLG